MYLPILKPYDGIKEDVFASSMDALDENKSKTKFQKFLL